MRVRVRRSSGPGFAVLTLFLISSVSEKDVVCRVGLRCRRKDGSGMLATPVSGEDLAREYTPTPDEVELIRRHRGDANPLESTVQLAYRRFPVSR